MATHEKIPRYADTLYQSAHDDMFSKPLYPDIPSVLPPGVDQQTFDAALQEFAAAVGEASTSTPARISPNMSILTRFRSLE